MSFFQRVVEEKILEGAAPIEKDQRLRMSETVRYCGQKLLHRFARRE
jgi:hypothetical protein